MTPLLSISYFVKAAVIWQRYLQTSNSLIIWFLHFLSFLCPSLPSYPPLFMSQCSPKISQDIKSDIQCPPLKWPPFWPPSPLGPLGSLYPPNFSFHSTEIFDFRVAAKKQRKNYILPPPLTFFGKSKTKNWKISVEFKMVKSLNTRFLNKKKDSILNSSIKKTNTFFHAKQKKNTKKGQFNLLACKDSDVAKQKKVKKKDN